MAAILGRLRLKNLRTQWFLLCGELRRSTRFLSKRDESKRAKASSLADPHQIWKVSAGQVELIHGHILKSDDWWRHCPPPAAKVNAVFTNDESSSTS